MADFFIRQGDTAPQLAATVQDEDGNAIDISGAKAVKFHMADPNYQTKVDASGTIVDGKNGKIAYAWSDGDTDERGWFYGEFQVTHKDDSVQTFPNRDYIRIRVERELA